MSEALNDEALIMLLKEKQDKQAVSELIKRYKKQAYLLALKLTGSHDDAMDASQEAFVKLYTKSSSYQSGKPFRPWFLRIVRNCTLNHMRTAFFRKKVASDELIKHIASSEHDPEAIVRYTKLWKMILSLPAKLREVLILRHHESMNYSQIAEVLGIPINTVATRIYLARKELGERYEM